MFKGLYTHPMVRFQNLYFKEKYENILDDRESIVGKKLNIFIIGCVFLAITSLLLGTIEELHDRYIFVFFCIDFFVSTIFLLEYWYRLQRAQQKLSFFIRPERGIELLSFAPFFLGLFFIPFMGLDILKILRLFGIFRIFSLSTHSPLVRGFIKTLGKYREEYIGAFGVFISFLIVFSTIVYFFERGVNPQFSSIPESLWWGIVTMTTLGYGDIVPITILGKIFGSILVFLGPVLLAIFSSITILVFMDVAEHSHEELVEKVCKNCSGLNPVSANYCMHCGKTEFEPYEEYMEALKKKKSSWVKKILS